MQNSKPSQSNTFWADDPSIWLSPPPLGGTTIGFSKFTSVKNDGVEVRNTSNSIGFRLYLVFVQGSKN